MLDLKVKKSGVVLVVFGFEGKEISVVFLLLDSKQRTKGGFFLFWV